MKRQSHYTFHPYSPRRRHLRAREGWKLTAILIPIIVGAIVLRGCIG